MLVPELYARLSILGKDNQIIASLGDDSERLKADKRSEFARLPANESKANS